MRQRMQGGMSAAASVGVVIGTVVARAGRIDDTQAGNAFGWHCLGLHSAAWGHVLDAR